MRVKRRRSAAVLAAVVTCSPVACSLLDPLDDIEVGQLHADASEPEASESTADVAVDVPTTETARCDVSDYDGGAVTEGFLCGVGACRKRLTGPSCQLVTLEDGGTQSPCATAFPVEQLGNDVDDNCDGVIDEGLASASPDAGFQCDRCAFGKFVQRLADGTLLTAGGVENREAHRNSLGCINSTLCSLGTAQWIRNVSGTRTCTAFCKEMGGACQPACSTSISWCNAAGIGTNLGTFATDYRCVVPPGHPYGDDGAPLVGDCEAQFPNVIDPSADFNLFCCCAL